MSGGRGQRQRGNAERLDALSRKGDDTAVVAVGRMAGDQKQPIAGTNCTSPTRPSWNVLRVRSYICQPTATACTCSAIDAAMRTNRNWTNAG